jgi:hypothetical protein
MIDNSAESNQSDNERHDNLRMTMMRVIKQHERWSKNSADISTNSSTRNTKLVTGGSTRRGSNISTGTDTIGSNILGDENLDAFLRLQLMHLSLSSKRQSQTMAKSFQQFSLLSTRSSSLLNEPPDYARNGSHFLDPFTTKRIDLIDQFPKALSESDIDNDALAAFCFPNGLRIRLVPRCAAEGARRLGWLGEHGDAYQLQGVSLIVVV